MPFTAATTAESPDHPAGQPGAFARAGVIKPDAHDHPQPAERRSSGLVAPTQPSPRRQPSIRANCPLRFRSLAQPSPAEEESQGHQPGAPVVPSPGTDGPRRGAACLPDNAEGHADPQKTRAKIPTGSRLLWQRRDRRYDKIKGSVSPNAHAPPLIEGRAAAASGPRGPIAPCQSAVVKNPCEQPCGDPGAPTARPSPARTLEHFECRQVGVWIRPMQLEVEITSVMVGRYDRKMPPPRRAPSAWGSKCQGSGRFQDH